MEVAKVYQNRTYLFKKEFMKEKVYVDEYTSKL